MNQSTLLIELGLAELPTAAVDALSQSFLEQILSALDESGIGYNKGKRFATARRLAVQVDGISSHQADQQIDKKGPALKAAKDNDGNWTKAAQGFAQSFGVTPDALTIEATPKGDWLYYRQTLPGKATATLIPSLLSKVTEQLPIAKRMRWGMKTESFVRPVETLVVMLDEAVIATELFGIHSGNQTLGHRFHGEKYVTINRADAYESALSDSYVIADIEKRKNQIVQQVHALVADIDSVNGAQAVIDESTLNEVNALVEYPVAILGEFNPRYLHIPQEVLIKTMQDNQKYFAVVDAQQKILPYFVTIANIQSNNPEVVRTGNQRVIEPRFADAEFFWENDKKHSLMSRRDALKKVVYQQKLGTVFERSERIATLAHWIAERCGFNSDHAIRAGQLAKCDLVTEMVFEFGELQGVIGEYYATLDGEPSDVAAAVREQYLPKFAGDELPKTETGLALALADKIENIVGGFAVGAKPTGTKDPYGLRRASIGVIRLLDESQLKIPLTDILAFASTIFDDAIDAASQLDTIHQYIDERLKGYYQDKGIRYDIVDAVLAVRPAEIYDITRRCEALKAFMTHKSAGNLFAANKRISNILKKTECKQMSVSESSLNEPAEKTLFEKLSTVNTSVMDAIKGQDYAAALAHLAELREPLDNFFDQVMVMSENEAEKNNRLALLSDIRELFLQVADVSEVVL